MIDVQQIKKDFPIYENDPDLVYLDSTATALKPRRVVEKLEEYYYHYPANIFRGIYKISERATAEYEETRDKVGQFINGDREEIIFTRSATESINLVAYSLGRKIIGRGDEVVVSLMEHHANFVPWQVLCFETGADFKVINSPQEITIPMVTKAVTKKTKILAITYVSNVLGVINPIKEIVRAARRINPRIIIVVDAAQAAPHLKINVRELAVDFIAFSSHKMVGPTGVGVLWGKKAILEEMFPFQYGGEMIDEVAIGKTTYANLPHKYEAGTPHISGVIGLKEAVAYLDKIGFDEISRHERNLSAYALKRLNEEFGDNVFVLGPKNINKRSGIISFTFYDFHPHDVGHLLDEDNVAVRVGHHCAMPLHTALKINASVRASFYIYNDRGDVDKLIKALIRVRNVLGKKSVNL